MYYLKLNSRVWSNVASLMKQLMERRWLGVEVKRGPKEKEKLVMGLKTKRDRYSKMGSQFKKKSNLDT